MRRILKTIDNINEQVGKLVRWLGPILVLVCLYGVIVRYVFNRPSIQAPVLMTMIGAAFASLSWGYIYLHEGHVRIDILYSHFSPRGRAIINVISTLVFFFPVMGLLGYAAGWWMWYAWATGESSKQTFWYPPLGPIRTIVFLGICLFILQGLARFIRDLYLVLRNKPYD